MQSPSAAILGLVTDLGDGERAAIASRSRKSDLLLLDDALARRHAQLSDCR